MTRFKNEWFSANPNHSLGDSSGEPVPHVYFDTTPDFVSVNQYVNVVIAVAEGSEHAYAIDLASGQQHYSHTFCKQKDVWNLHSGSIHRPNFSVGYIPRVLDQIGGPQKVIVFSKRKHMKQSLTTNYYRVKLLGAYVEQLCPIGNCLGKNNWLSRLVFIGVDGEDSELRALETVDDFKRSFDWSLAKAILENVDGRNFVGTNTYPAVRVGSLIVFDEAFDYFKKRSIFLTDSELKKIQKSCHALYDKLWEDVGRERAEEKPATTNAELKAKIKLQADLRKDQKPVGFAERFQVFTKSYFKEMATCDNFVYHGNINRDQEKFWFMSFIGLFYRLHRDGYFYDCNQKRWQKNVLTDVGKPYYDLLRDMKNCREAQLDLAMEYLPNFLVSLKAEREYYRFVDYDNHPYGTHKKIYSWVKMKNLKMDCGNDPNLPVRESYKLFPEDVRWSPRFKKDSIQDGKVIL